MIRKPHDKDLVIQATSGDVNALAELFARRTAKLRTVCYRHLRSEDEIDDVISISAEQVLKSIHSLRYPERFDWWLQQLVANQALSYARRRERHAALVDELATVAGPTSGTGVDPAVDIARKLDLVEALDLLKEDRPEQAEAIVLYYRLHYTYEEIAQRQNISTNTVGTRLRTARRKLAWLLNDGGKQ